MTKEQAQRAAAYIESWIDFNFPHARIPGLVVAIQQGDEIILNKAWGMADMEKGIPMRPEHTFRIASHSKMFTAVALMQLVEQKKLKLNEPLVTYLPWLKEAKDKRYRKITARQVLEHSAGIIRDGNRSDYWNFSYPFPSKEQLIQEFKNTNLVYASGTHFKYSNYGFSLLGLLLEAVSGISYEEYVRKNIFEPLHMETAGVDFEGDAESIHLATGYSRETQELTRTALQNVSTNGMVSATGLYATAEDLCKFTRVLYGKNAVLPETGRQGILRKRWKTDLRDSTNYYGWGSEMEKFGPRWYVGHGGGFSGFITDTKVDVENKFTVVVLRNSIGDPVLTRKICQLLQFFENVKTTASAREADVCTGRYENLWTSIDIVNRGDRLIGFNAANWGMPEGPDELKRVKGDEYVIEKASGYGAPGEQVKFNRVNGKVESATWAGSEMRRIASFS